jgi:hypothetical protein
MATETLPATERTFEALAEVAHAQSNALHDVRALLSALCALTEELSDDGQADYIQRVARQADSVFRAIHAAFIPYI